MRRSAVAFAFVVTTCACRRDDPTPAKADLVVTTTTVDASSQPPPPPPPLPQPPTPSAPPAYFRSPKNPDDIKTASDCRALATPAGKGCHWGVEQRVYCSGAAPPAGMRMAYPTCVCHACDVDVDCSERSGGRCIALSAGRCVTGTMRVCVYPSEACYPGEGCDGGQCAPDDFGHARCLPASAFWPPP